MTETAYEIAHWLDAVAAVLVLAGACIVLIGNLGLVWLKNFYDRVHAPTLGATLGAFLILLAAILHFMNDGGKTNLVPLLILGFITLTTPVSLIMLVRAALYRDRIEKRPGTPGDSGHL